MYVLYERPKFFLLISDVKKEIAEFAGFPSVPCRTFKFQVNMDQKFQIFKIIYLVKLGNNEQLGSDKNRSV